MKKVLVIEDNDNNLYLITFILEQNNYTVIAARDGLSGISMADTESPDLILMDVQLPDIDGIEATRRIRKKNSSTPIIAVTSYAMVGDDVKALAAGCNGYITKPINPDTFLNDVQKFLE